MADYSLPNKLAALSLAVSDAVVAETGDLAPTAMAALVKLNGHEQLSVGEIAGIVGLTHSATVRLIDRLERDWMVRRQRRVGREVLVEITTRGRRRAADFQAARIAATGAVLGGLDDGEKAELGRLITKMFGQVEAPGPSRGSRCRFCDVSICDCGEAA